MTDKRSRTSGRNSAAEQGSWARRPGTPGGGRSEAEKQGRPAWSPPRWEVTPEVVAAYRARDAARLRVLLELEVWELGPWLERCPSDRGHGEGIGACGCRAVEFGREIRAAIAEAEGSDG